ncbi:MAG: hydrogenase nickel incorporation protein HypB [Planctomycetales bacterium]|nr:hydrogenase nickel incorporation protein HypB [Planctomycetales bacterium]
MSQSTIQHIEVHTDLAEAKKRAACEFRTSMANQGTFVVNLVSSPGAGKTSLLEATAKHWGASHQCAVLVGDLATHRDADRLAPFFPVRQLTTGGACHLELELVARGLAELPQLPYQYLFIENVGNLVCPASHDLGEHVRVVLVSTTEGDDKPGKYPKMFRTSQLLVVTKTDLLNYVPFSVDNLVQDARRIQGSLETIEVCSLSQFGISIWCDWLTKQREQMLQNQTLFAERGNCPTQLAVPPKVTSFAR